MANEARDCMEPVMHNNRNNGQGQFCHGWVLPLCLALALLLLPQWAWAEPQARQWSWAKRRMCTYRPLITVAADHYSLPPALLLALVAVESAFQSNALSPKGAMGLAQLMPGTAAAMGVTDPWEPVGNVFGGARYLRQLANQFAGDLRLTLAAYNAGPERVSQAGGIPAIAETQAYVERIMALYAAYLGVLKGDDPCLGVGPLW